jgi:hypothetical protein
MTQVVLGVDQPPDGGYTPRAVGDSIFTEADTLQQLRSALRDVVRCHYDDERRPAVIPLRLPGRS